MAATTNSLFTVLGLLSALLGAGWVIYKMLENVQDSAKGLSIEAGMARSETRALARKARQRQTPPPAAPEASPPLSHARPGTPRNAIHFPRRPASPTNVPSAAAKTEMLQYYPRIVYQCPYASEIHLNPPAREVS